MAILASAPVDDGVYDLDVRKVSLDDAGLRLEADVITTQETAMCAECTAFHAIVIPARDFTGADLVVTPARPGDEGFAPSVSTG